MTSSPFDKMLKVLSAITKAAEYNDGYKARQAKVDPDIASRVEFLWGQIRSHHVALELLTDGMLAKSVEESKAREKDDAIPSRDDSFEKFVKGRMN